MFTGLVEKMGRVSSMDRGKLVIETGFHDLSLGESISVNGVCLTWGKGNAFRVVKETLSRTNLGAVKRGQRVNLERALLPTDRLGGHIVQGHIDGTGTVLQNGKELHIKVPVEMASQMVVKGSVAVDGVSLTVAGVTFDSFWVALIPHTRKHTTLGERKKGQSVNLELDILGKYVRQPSRITTDFLKEAGFLD